ncbi:hypothetical protein BaRGS_00008139 [Batillaria attramentaria]|uniref:Uncharacterized protein n=1 Tax=Batillaria attramentaria TaxID=370345 RepID=A0ABD0LMC8_9CAEN
MKSFPPQNTSQSRGRRYSVRHATVPQPVAIRHARLASLPLTLTLSSGLLITWEGLNPPTSPFHPAMRQLSTLPSQSFHPCHLPLFCSTPEAGGKLELEVVVPLVCFG